MKLLQETKSKFLKNLFSSEFKIGPETRKCTPSLGTQFKKSLDSLMSILSAWQPFFIRCIKPNEYKASDVNILFFVKENIFNECFLFFYRISIVY